MSPEGPSTADDVYAVILAGGSGTRFWPKSRHLTPKQLCHIGDAQQTMLELTLSRLDGFIAPERRIIVTHIEQMEATRRLAGARCGHYLAEPEARNTANALAYAALHIEAIAPQGRRAIMVSLHADHLIRDVDAFKATIMESITCARHGYLALLGIVPQYAETGYGYIEKGETSSHSGAAFHVRSFREKPELPTAQEYVNSGRFLWNAGIFTWRVDTILDELSQRLPTTVKMLGSLAQKGKGFAELEPASLEAVYSKLTKISVDHAVLEVSDKVAVVPADIGWQDVGSWDALARCFSPDAKGNLTFGDALLIDSLDTTIDTDGPFVAGIGLKDLVVVCAKGAVLVCPKDRAQEVKDVVSWLKEQGRTHLI